MHRTLSAFTAPVVAASIALLIAGCGAPAAAPTPAPVAVEYPMPTTPTPGTERAQPEAPAVDAPAAGPAGEVSMRPATEAQAAPSPPPVSLEVAGTEIDVAVIDVGLAGDSGDVTEMEIPESFYEAGWYRYGPAPGAPEGNAVLAAHIDIGTEQMPFADLKDVPVGTLITVGRRDAEPVRYVVTDVRNEAKATLDTDRIFRRDGDHQLVIVTCGGRWLADQDDYEDNVVLTASPL